MLPGQQYRPEDLLRIAWRRWWMIAIPLVVAAAGSVVVARQLPNRYRSETVILVVPQRVPESYVRSTVVARIEDRLLSIQQQILSRSRLERIILDFDLYPEERQRLVMEDVVERMRRDIEGPRIERGDSFRVGYVSRDPRLAQRVTERLASLFIDENLRDREVLADATSEFLDAQLEEAKQRLLEKEKRLEQYRRQHAGELPSQVDGNLQAIQRMQMQIQALTEALNRDVERRTAIERQIADLESATVAPITAPSAPGDGPPAGASTAERLEAATAALRALELRLKPEHPDVQIAQRRVRDLEAQLQAEHVANAGASAVATPVGRPIDALRQNRLRDLRGDIEKIDLQIAARQDEERRLRAQVDTYQAKVDGAPTRESELTELMRDYSTLDGSYKTLLAKHEDSKLAASLERRQVGEQFKVLDPARVPERPFSPNRLRIILMATLAGLGFGVGIVGLLEYLDSSFKTDREVSRLLKIPVFATIPLMRSEGDVRRQRRRRLAAAAAAIAVVVVSASALAAWKLQWF